jgi:hypothetical protein
MTQGIVQRVGDAAWRNVNVVVPPLPVLAAPTVLWAYLGGSLAASQNMIAGSPAITEVGTPEYPTLTVGNIVRVGPLNATQLAKGYLDTHLPDDSKSFTLVFSARINGMAGLAEPLSVGQVGGNNFGINVNLGVAQGGLGCSLNGNGISRLLPVVNAYKMKTYVITYDDPTFTQSIYNITDGTSDTFTGSSFTRALSNNGTFTIGFNPLHPVGILNPSDVAMVGKISGSVNPTQAQQIGANVRATLAMASLPA